MELSVSPEMDFQVSFERGQNRITEPARRLGCGLATLVGMCLKMALARILQPNLKFLAFDEPSAQLDPLKKEAFAQFLKSLSQQALTGNQVLVIEHDLGIAQSCDHQIRLT
jgi:DNA repair exonuclease SbcCD ATPase subunit